MIDRHGKIVNPIKEFNEEDRKRMGESAEEYFRVVWGPLPENAQILYFGDLEKDPYNK